MARLVLVGLPGVGKSRVGALVAEARGCAFIDTDEMIAMATGMEPGAYLREHGEAAFRKEEAAVLAAALDSDAVVATGGGIVTMAETREQLRRHMTIWLDCDDAIAVERLSGGDRPLLGDDERAGLSRLRAERSKWYEEVARARVDASGDAEEVARRVAALLAEMSA